MKKIFKLPTIIGLVILLLGMFAGIFLINSKSIFKLGAQTANNPKNVRISNITDTSFVISWTTDNQTTGFIKWGNSQNNIAKVVNETKEQKSYTHWINITNLAAGEPVYFKINSEGTDWDNNGIPWQVKTAIQPINPSSALNLSGSIVEENGAPSSDSIVYISTQGSLVSTTTSSSGSWLIPLSNFISLNSNSSLLEISVDGGKKGTSTAVIYPETAKNTPLIMLGKTYDFRTITPTTDPNLPEGEVSLPDAIEASSRFEVGDVSTGEQTHVTLDSINNGEIVTTTNPEFFGTGPNDVQIEITVESEAQSTSLTPNSEGRWNWSPPNNLTPGEHTITMKWRDKNGVIRSISRKFIVQAAEGPAFVSTPSATPIRTTSPTPTHTSTPVATATTLATSIPTRTAIATATSTPESLPDAGVLTPTLGLFIMGLGILISSFFVYKTADEQQY